MTTPKTLDPKTAARQIAAGEATLIDIREADEHAREHIAGALSLPLSAIDRGDLHLEAGRTAVFHCKSGMRTEANCSRLFAHVEGEAYLLEGGLEGWKQAGLETVKDERAPLELQRQVQIAAGGMILLGLFLGFLLGPAWFGLSGFVGAGLMFAGLSGWCGMAKLLAVMPWNRTAPA